ncbi:MAG: 4'-phosphopantetheinyl transferase family protein [Limnospira sp.]
MQIWQADLNLEPAQIEPFRQLLTPDERERARRFRFDRDRIHFTVARGILRQILSPLAGVSPEDLTFGYGDRGKPYLKTGNPGGTLQFNVSHSHGRALYAIAFDRRVGVDLESFRPVEGLQLARRFFCDREYEKLRSESSIQRQTALFFQIWSAKEAFLKATGTGLIGLKDVEILWTHSREIYLSKIAGDSVNNWSLKPLNSGENWAASVVVEGRNLAIEPTPKIWDSHQF